MKPILILAHILRRQSIRLILLKFDQSQNHLFQQTNFEYIPELPEATHSLTFLTLIKKRLLCF
jgi:hypothetical protein